MPQFHQHAGGVYVRTDAVTYGDTLENFAIDNGAPPPPLPEGITERVYDQNKRHALNRGHDTVDSGPLPWPEGDAIIASIDNLIAARDARLARAKDMREPTLDMGADIKNVVMGV